MLRARERYAFSIFLIPEISCRGQCRSVWFGRLVFHEVETLAAVKGKLMVARQEREPLGDGIVADFIDQHLEAILFIERYSSAISINGEESACRL